jgi:hypothetical protein
MGELLKIAGSFDGATQVRLDGLASSEIAGHMKGEDVRSTPVSNALPLVMQLELGVEPPSEAACFTDVDGVPASVQSFFAEDVYTGAVEICRADGVKLERVCLAADPGRVH